MAQKHFRQANVRVSVDGRTAHETTAGNSLETMAGEHITRVLVDRRLDAPDYFAVDYDLVVHSTMTFIDSLVEGQAVEIQIGYGSTSDMKTIFKGEIAYVEPVFDSEGHSLLTIAGYDVSHRLTRGTRSRVWGDGVQQRVRTADAVEDIISDSGSPSGGSDGLAVRKHDRASLEVPYVAQLWSNDYALLRTLAADAGRHAVVGGDDGKSVEVHDANASQAVLTIGRDRKEDEGAVVAKSARFRLSTVQQVSRVVVRGWDPAKKKAIVGVAESLSHKSGKNPGTELTAKALYGSTNGGREVVIVDRPVGSTAEAKAMAQAILDDLSLDFVTAEVEVEGDPTLIPDAIVTLTDFGKRFSGDYRIRGVQHVFVPEAVPYTCRLDLVRNAVDG